MKAHPTTASSPKITAPDLIIYPTAIALRQTQRRALEREGFFDGRRHLTLSAFLNACGEAALARQKLRPITDLDRELAIVEAVHQFRGKRPSPPPSPLKGEGVKALTSAALEETLSQLIDTVAPLADRAGEFLQLLAADRRIPKNPELAALHAAYAAVCRTLGVADDATLNAAILELLRGDQAQWPLLLRQARTIAFIAVRWVAPFQESVIRALSDRLGQNNVVVRHILTDYEQDWWGGSLLTDTGRLLFGDAQSLAGECEYQSDSTRSAIEHLTSLREGYAMQDRALAEQSRARVGFSCSVGVYGEIEDLARRIAWELHDRPDPVRPEEICLVTRNLGAAADAIMDVFARFNIPYYFRRGIPVLAVPVIKTLLDFARLSASRERDVFCALLQSPWVNWSHTGLDPTQLADDLLRSGVEPTITDPARMARRLAAYAWEQRRFTDRAEADSYAKTAAQAFTSAAGKTGISSFNAGLADVILRSETFQIGKTTPPPLDNTDSNRAWLLNTKAWETVTDTIATLQRHALVGGESGASVSWDDVVDLLNRTLENITVSSAPPDEAGVWILNPYDIAGLSFKVVLLAGLNAGAFPKSPTPSPLFPDAELLDYRDRLQKKGRLPVAALAASKARNSQENLLFLTTLAASRERMVFSYASHDETGQGLTPSVFFSTLWRLVGWPAWTTMPAEPPDPYDSWRLSKSASHLVNHWREHLRQLKGKPAIATFKRRPFPGESYLGTVPLELCRANDERRQRIASQRGEDRGSGKTENTPHLSPLPQGERKEGILPLPSGERAGVRVSSLAAHIAHGIEVEHQRQAFFARQGQETMETPVQATDLSSQPGHEYAGILDPALWTRIQPAMPDSIPDFSPTQLERLVACPYQYYLQYVLKVEAIEPNDLEPSPMDFGTAIHAILFHGFRLLQGYAPDNSIPGLAKVANTYRHLFIPAWAVSDGKGVWHLQETPERPSPDALPLVNFPADEQAVLAFFDDLSKTMLDWATSGNAVWMLGAPEQLNVQRRRIGRAVRNLVRTALDPESIPESPACEGGKRYPALLEYTFSNKSRKADASSLELTDPSHPEHRLRLHGKIDRVDFVFDSDRILQSIIVLDYKGSTKAKLKSEDLAEGISAATDCQLPTYALAATRALRPDLKSQISDLKLQVPLLMHYLSYSLSATDMVKQCRKQWIGLDGNPLDAGDLAAAFTRSAFAALSRYERGDFAVAPQACEFCTLKACCRHAAGLLSPESPDNGSDS